MPRFFVSAEQIENEFVKIVGDDAFHISRALRMAAGEHITVCTPDGTEYDCVLEVFAPDNVSARIKSRRKSETEPPFEAYVYQGLPKGDKLETVIQKAVECGAVELTPFESEFCVAKSKPEAEEKRTERRQRIALEAAKQSGRGALPTVNVTVSFDEMLKRASKADFVLFCYEGQDTLPIGRAIKGIENFENEKGRRPKIAIVVGSEGGFSEKEARMAAEAGFVMCGLGKRILRTETAAMFALSCLVCATELS